jgi:autotransporter-associated beta strand protein
MAAGTSNSIQGLTPIAAWTGASSTIFADSGNWSGSVPGSIASTTNTDTALFNQNAPHSPLTIDTGRNIQNITFDTANVNSLSIGTLGGPALLLTAGGTIQTTATVVNPQTVNAPLVLEGDYTFTSGSSSSSATLTFADGISPGATSGTTTLTLNGGNNGANIIRGLSDNGSGQLAVTISGTGQWIFEGANSYSGGTAINAGILLTTGSGGLGVGPLTINAANNISSVLNLGGDEIVSNATVVQSGTGAALVNVAAGATLTSTGALTMTGALNLAGAGTLEIDGSPRLNDNSNLNLTGGTLRFNVTSRTPTIGTGVTAVVFAGATLELAGSVSALANGANLVNITNQSNDPGILVSGTNQQVGNIDGLGTTQVSAGSDLTANHIIQSALEIGGTSKNPGVVTIDASDALGNPLGQPSRLGRLMLAGLISSNDPFALDMRTPSLLNGPSTNDSSVAFISADGSIPRDRPVAVLEPSTIVLSAAALICLLNCGNWRPRSFPPRN